ncbi:unnamed protein product, partial [marine sediment metagenome]
AEVANEESTEDTEPDTLCYMKLRIHISITLPTPPLTYLPGYRDLISDLNCVQ